MVRKDAAAGTLVFFSFRVIIPIGRTNYVKMPLADWVTFFYIDLNPRGLVRTTTMLCFFRASKNLLRPAVSLDDPLLCVQFLHTLPHLVLQQHLYPYSQ